MSGDLEQFLAGQESPDKGIGLLQSQAEGANVLRFIHALSVTTYRELEGYTSSQKWEECMLARSFLALGGAERTDEFLLKSCVEAFLSIYSALRFAKDKYALTADLPLDFVEEDGRVTRQALTMKFAFASSFAIIEPLLRLHQTPYCVYDREASKMYVNAIMHPELFIGTCYGVRLVYPGLTNSVTPIEAYSVRLLLPDPYLFNGVLFFSSSHLIQPRPDSEP